MTTPVVSPHFQELQRLVRHLGEELGGFRRRALQAEARVRELEEALGRADEEAPRRARGAEGADRPARGDARVAASDDVASADDLPPVGTAADPASLAAENAALRERLNAATARSRQMLERVRFLRQQQGHQPQEGAR